MSKIFSVHMDYEELVVLQQLLVKKGWIRWTDDSWKKEDTITSFIEAIISELESQN